MPILWRFRHFYIIGVQIIQKHNKKPKNRLKFAIYISNINLLTRRESNPPFNHSSVINPHFLNTYLASTKSLVKLLVLMCEIFTSPMIYTRAVHKNPVLIMIFSTHKIVFFDSTILLS